MHVSDQRICLEGELDRLCKNCENRCVELVISSPLGGQTAKVFESADGSLHCYAHSGDDGVRRFLIWSQLTLVRLLKRCQQLFAALVALISESTFPSHQLRQKLTVAPHLRVGDS